MKQVIDADGHITTFTAYDPAGLKSIVTYPNNDTHVFGYDNDKNLTTRQTANTTIQNTATLKNSSIGWSDSAGLSRSALGVTLAHRVARVVARHVLAAREWAAAGLLMFVVARCRAGG